MHVLSKISAAAFMVISLLFQAIFSDTAFMPVQPSATNYGSIYIKCRKAFRYYAQKVKKYISMFNLTISHSYENTTAKKIQSAFLVQYYPKLIFIILFHARIWYFLASLLMKKKNFKTHSQKNCSSFPYLYSTCFHACSHKIIMSY